MFVEEMQCTGCINSVLYGFADGWNHQISVTSVASDSIDVAASSTLALALYLEESFQSCHEVTLAERSSALVQ